MAGTVCSREREEALVRLLDDESPVVRRALLEELQRLGPVGRNLLQRVQAESDPPLSDAAQSLLDLISGPDPVEAFRVFIRSLEYELETGSMLLSRVIKRDADPVLMRGQLELLAHRCRDLMVKRSSPLATCRVINRVLFHEFGFRGNAEDYEDPLNSFLHTVLRRRKGIPISLSILYILVAGRCGLELEPVALPGHFVVACFKRDVFFVDPFERGQIREFDEMCMHLKNAKFSEPENLLVPCPVGEVLCRCCRNLVHHYTIKGDPLKARMFAGLVREFDETYRRETPF